LVFFSADCRFGLALEQADFQVGGDVDEFAVSLQPSVADTQRQLATQHPLDVDAIFDDLRRGQDHAFQLDLTDREGTTLSRRADPAEEEAEHLPKGIKPEATGHHRIALEMAEKEPEVGPDVEFGANLAIAVLAALTDDPRDPVEHQHRRRRQPRVAGTKEFPVCAIDQVFISIPGLPTLNF